MKGDFLLETTIDSVQGVMKACEQKLKNRALLEQQI